MLKFAKHAGTIYRYLKVMTNYMESFNQKHAEVANFGPVMPYHCISIIWKLWPIMIGGRWQSRFMTVRGYHIHKSLRFRVPAVHLFSCIRSGQRPVFTNPFFLRPIAPHENMLKPVSYFRKVITPLQLALTLMNDWLLRYAGSPKQVEKGNNEANIVTERTFEHKMSVNSNEAWPLLWTMVVCINWIHWWMLSLA